MSDGGSKGYRCVSDSEAMKQIETIIFFLKKKSKSKRPLPSRDYFTLPSEDLDLGLGIRLLRTVRCTLRKVRRTVTRIAVINTSCIISLAVQFKLHPITNVPS